jgi:hypothetical protein
VTTKTIEIISLKNTTTMTEEQFKEYQKKVKEADTLLVKINDYKEFIQNLETISNNGNWHVSISSPNNHTKSVSKFVTDDIEDASAELLKSSAIKRLKELEVKLETLLK